MGHMKLGHLCFATGFASEIGQSIFHKLKNHRAGQAADEFQRSQGEASFDQLLLRDHKCLTPICL